MRIHLKTLLFGLLGLAATTQSQAGAAGTWPPAPGDLVLGFQATGGQGNTTNLFYNLGPGFGFRDTPDQAALGDLATQLETVYGMDWFTRDDLYFGVIANRSPFPTSGFSSVGPENGDSSRTFYVSRASATNDPGTAIPYAPLNSSQLGTAGQTLAGQVSMLAGLTADLDGVATLSSTDSVRFANSWTTWNPFFNGGQAIAYKQFGGGIQSSFDKGGTVNVDLFRILGIGGTSSYITTISIDAAGEVSAARVGGGLTFVSVSPGATTNGVIAGSTGILYEQGSNAVLRAIPNPGYGFVDWDGDADAFGSTNPITLLMDGDKSVTANFVHIPDVTTPTSTNITDTEATLGGTVANNYGQPLTERGVVFMINTVGANPQIGGSGVTKVSEGGTAVSAFTTAVTSLTPGTTYAFAAYATSAPGTGYSTVARFTTDTNVDLTGGVGTVTAREILAGDTQLFRFNLGGASDVAFTGIGATATEWELFKGLDSVANGTGNVNFSDVLLAGDYSLRLTNTGGTTETVSLNLDASNEAAPKADVSVNGSGADVYAPVGQSTAATSVKAGPVSVPFAVDNDGPVDDTFKVQGSGGDALFGVTYFQGGANVTAQVIAGTYTTPSLAAGDAPVGFTMNVTPNKKKLTKKFKKKPGKKPKKPKILKKSIVSSIRATASSNAAISDAATITVSTK